MLCKQNVSSHKKSPGFLLTGSVCDNRIMLFLYLDESGDLGFDFVTKKPSKFFVVTILAVQGQDNNRQIINGVKKTVRRKLNPPGKRSRIVQELKGTCTTLDVRKYFYDQVKDIDFKIYTIILNKKRVYRDLAGKKNRLYNYIARVLLEKIPFEDAAVRVNLIIDKSKGKPEILNFNHYIQSQLEARISPVVPLHINHIDSCDNRGIQAVDMFSYGVFEAHERRKPEWFAIFEEKVAFRTVYLPE